MQIESNNFTNSNMNFDYLNQKHVEVEPILKENSQRFVLFPLKYHDMWEMYKKHKASFWTAEEIDLEQDLRDWENLNDNELSMFDLEMKKYFEIEKVKESVKKQFYFNI